MLLSSFFFFRGGVRRKCYSVLGYFSVSLLRVIVWACRLGITAVLCFLGVNRIVL